MKDPKGRQPQKRADRHGDVTRGGRVRISLYLFDLRLHQKARGGEGQLGGGNGARQG